MTGVTRPTEVAELGAATVEYRHESRGEDAALIFPGGHMHAGFAVGEESFAGLGYSVLAVTRPGYGRTMSAPPSADSPTAEVERFCDAVHSLCEQLRVRRVVAVGISAGGPTALAMAQRHPRLVQKLILQSSVGPAPWPDARTRAVARLTLGPGGERLTWGFMRAMMKTSRQAGLVSLVGQLSTLPGKQAVTALTQQNCEDLAAAASQLRSGRGFLRDLDLLRSPRAWRPQQDALVIHSRRDGSVPFSHAEELAAMLPQATLMETSAEHHLIWFASDWPRVASRIRAFLAP